MSLMKIFLALVFGYLAGSIPWGYFVVRLINGKNVTKIESGRTGGTNAMRAAGLPAGLITTSLDVLKSAVVVWVLQNQFPGQVWLHVFGALLAVVGHNYSIFLIKRDPSGKITLGGGAGGTPAVGGLIGFWWPIGLILIPFGAVIIFGVGYASVATMTMPILGSIILLFRFFQIGTPWEYAVFGLLAEVLIVWALRPNIKRLIAGNERLVGIRAKKKREDR